MDIQWRKNETLEDIISFYLSVGYSGGAREDDDILLAFSQEKIIGSVRMCDEEGYLVLRGMFIDQNFQGKKLGRKMLAILEKYIIDREIDCFCVPHDDLDHFYAEIGFSIIEDNEAPIFLSKRAKGYRDKGQGVFIMKRTFLS